MRIEIERDWARLQGTCVEVACFDEDFPCAIPAYSPAAWVPLLLPMHRRALGRGSLSGLRRLGTSGANELQTQFISPRPARIANET